MEKKSELQDSIDRFEKASRIYAVVIFLVAIIYISDFCYKSFHMPIFIWICAISFAVVVGCLPAMIIYPYWDKISGWWKK